jgi:hypothetical protein
MQNRLQEIFDKISNHLLTQNKRSAVNGNGVCMYRFENLKCAAGCLIPDELYDSKMEFKKVTELDYFKNNFSDIEIPLIRQLQDIHDDFEPLEWSLQIKIIAAQWNLECKL